MCFYQKNNAVEKIKGCRRVSRNDEEQLKIAVEKVGPIAVSFFSRIPKFKDYEKGEK